jgi:hypothetical protein
VKFPGSKNIAPNKFQPRCDKPQNRQAHRGIFARRAGLLLGLEFGIATFCGPAEGGETAYLNPSADTALLENFPTNNFGGQKYFNAGTTQNYTRNRGLIKFDLAAQLPAGAKITAVSLTVEVVGQPIDGDNPSTFELHRMLRDWGEGAGSGNPPTLGRPALPGEADWTYRFAQTTNIWATPGGLPNIDFADFGSSEQYIYGTSLSPYTFESSADTVADAQLWLDSPASNFGWMLISRSETDNFSARRFASREDLLRAPILTVDYFVVKIDQISITEGKANLSFTAEAGYPYRLEFCDALSSSTWQTLTNVPPQAATDSILVQDTLGGVQRYYRLAVP